VHHAIVHVAHRERGAALRTPALEVEAAVSRDEEHLAFVREAGQFVEDPVEG